MGLRFAATVTLSRTKLGGSPGGGTGCGELSCIAAAVFDKRRRLSCWLSSLGPWKQLDQPFCNTCGISSLLMFHVSRPFVSQRNKYVGVSLPKVKAEATVGLLKGEDKHHVRLGTVWPCGTGKGQVSARSSSCFCMMESAVNQNLSMGDGMRNCGVQAATPACAMR